jgi:hypothetical protein
MAIRFSQIEESHFNETHKNLLAVGNTHLYRACFGTRHGKRRASEPA